MQIRSAVFELSAPDLKSCPKSAFPEFAFIGRSNVGKSSMINMLTGQKDLAKVSATPGKTRMINFFLINNHWHLIDLPGYGYAKVGKRERADFSEAIASYMEERPNLRWVFILIDSRLTPQPIDLEFIRWTTEREIPFSLIFTKADKSKPNALKKSITTFMETIAEICPIAPAAFITSSKVREGRPEILGFIDSCLSNRIETAEATG
ncbi:ribosome biogenesis GTP-binding protein YihA/YsxC [soil metagenome]